MPYLAISSKTTSIHGFGIARFQVTSEQAENSWLSGTDLPVATQSMRTLLWKDDKQRDFNVRRHDLHSS